MDPAIAELVGAWRRLPLGGDAGELQAAAESAATALGWSVRREVWVKIPDAERWGRIDLVCARGRLRVAVECDRGSARDRSLRKLRLYWSATERVVIVRRRAVPSRESGVLVVGIGESWHGP